MFQLNAVPKPQHKRNKPTAKQRGSISPSTRLQLRERSKGICERCCSARATEAAHTLRRWKVRGKTTLQDVCHLCTPCHNWADESREGRLFLKQFRMARYKATGTEYYE